MNFFIFLFLINLKIFISFNIHNILPLKEIFFNKNIENNYDQEYIIESIRKYLKNSFIGFNETSFNKCSKYLFEKTGSVENFLHLLSYSGKGIADLGQETTCLRNDFSYFLITYNYIKKDNEIFNFLENSNFYTGLCLLNDCNELIENLFDGFSENIINQIKVQEIKYEKDKECKNNLINCQNEAYYSLNENGKFDENLTKKEK